MAKNFEPTFKTKSEIIFKQWESKSDLAEAPIDEKELFKQSCEKLKEEAKAQGYAEGMKAAEAHIQQLKKEFSSAFHALMQPMQLLDEALIKELITTMLWICQACIRLEISINPDKLSTLFNVIKEELPSLKGNKILAVHPEDLAWLNAQTEDEIFNQLQPMLIADADLARGDFYLQGDQGVLDGHIITRLSHLFPEYITKADFNAAEPLLE